MTSPTDEITNLRRGLEDIRSWCDHNARYDTNPAVQVTCQHLAAMARRVLKTPRASKVLTVGEIMDDSDMRGCQ